MDYATISKEAIGYLYKSHNSLQKSGIDEKLLALAHLRVAQINGCAFCCGFHSQELRDFGIRQEVIDKIPGWKLSAAFDNTQKIVLEWTEIITLLKPEASTFRTALVGFFSEKEIVDLTASIALMNTLTRLHITLGDGH